MDVESVTVGEPSCGFRLRRAQRRLPAPQGGALLERSPLQARSAQVMLRPAASHHPSSQVPGPHLAIPNVHTHDAGHAVLQQAVCEASGRQA